MLLFLIIVCTTSSVLELDYAAFICQRRSRTTDQHNIQQDIRPEVCRELPTQRRTPRPNCYKNARNEQLQEHKNQDATGKSSTKQSTTAPLLSYIMVSNTVMTMTNNSYQNKTET
jgi:hypothetical protein